MILAFSNRVNSRYRAVEKAIDEFIICEHSSELIKQVTNELTDNARLFVITQNPYYAMLYLKEIEDTDSLGKALAMIRDVCDESDLAYQRLMIAMDQAKGLMTMELYAIRLGYRVLDDYNIPDRIKEIAIRPADLALSKEELKETAINNLFGEGYLIYRDRINTNCSVTIDAIELLIKNELNMNSEELGENIRRLRIQFLVLLVINALLFIFFGILI